LFGPLLLAYVLLPVAGFAGALLRIEVAWRALRGPLRVRALVRVR
jgi:hypothetical protein